MRRINLPYLADDEPLRQSAPAEIARLEDLARSGEEAALAAVDQRKSNVVELRFFGGLSVAETAEALHVSPETVMRDWKVAKVWLLRELNRDPSHVD